MPRLPFIRLPHVSLFASEISMSSHEGELYVDKYDRVALLVTHHLSNSTHLPNPFTLTLISSRMIVLGLVVPDTINQVDKVIGPSY